jgi:hypothetical protein
MQGLSRIAVRWTTVLDVSAYIERARVGLHTFLLSVHCPVPLLKPLCPHFLMVGIVREDQLDARDQLG